MIVNKQHVASVIEEETLKYLNELIYREADALLLEAVPGGITWWKNREKLKALLKIFDGGVGNTRTALKYFDEMIEAAKISVQGKRGAGFPELRQIINDAATSIKETTRLMKTALGEIGKKVIRVPASGRSAGNYVVGEISIVFDNTVAQLEKLSHQLRQMANKYEDVAIAFEKQYARMTPAQKQKAFTKPLPGGVKHQPRSRSGASDRRVGERPQKPHRPTRGSLRRSETPDADMAAWRREMAEYEKAMIQWKAEVGTRRLSRRQKALSGNISDNRHQSRQLNQQADEIDDLALWLRDQAALIENKHAAKMEEKIAAATAEGKSFNPKQLEELEIITATNRDRELKAIVTTVQKDGKIFNQKIARDGGGKKLKNVEPHATAHAPEGAPTGAPTGAPRPVRDTASWYQRGKNIWTAVTGVTLATGVYVFNQWWRSWSVEEPVERAMDRIEQAGKSFYGGVEELTKDTTETIKNLTSAGSETVAGQGRSVRDFENQVRSLQWEPGGIGGKTIPYKGQQLVLKFAKEHPAEWEEIYKEKLNKREINKATNYKPDSDNRYSQGHYRPGPILWWYTAKELNKLGKTFKLIKDYGQRGRAPADAVKYLKHEIKGFRSWVKETLGLAGGGRLTPHKDTNAQIKKSYKELARKQYGPFFEIYGQMTMAHMFYNLFGIGGDKAKNIFKNFDPDKVTKISGGVHVGAIEHYKYQPACDILKEVEAGFGEIDGGGDWDKWGKYLKSYGIWTHQEYEEAVTAAKVTKQSLKQMYPKQWLGWNKWWWKPAKRVNKGINDTKWLEWRYKSFKALCAGNIDGIDETLKDWLRRKVMLVYKEAATATGKAKAAIGGAVEKVKDKLPQHMTIDDINKREER